jgi:tRNA A-37 threonylcarbamoyl transferase component Bud32
MTPPERFLKLRRVFESALEAPPGELDTILDRECEGDPDLRREVRELLDARRNAEDFLSSGETRTLTVRDGLAPGSLVAERYRLDRLLGEGGFGVVYLARDTHVLDKPVVVKLLRHKVDALGWALKKFHQECEALARIDHPGIIGVLDSGDLPDGRHFLVMEFVRGISLRAAITPQGMDLNRAAAIVRQLGDALAAAHSQGVFHRDLKPENILLKDLGGGREMAVIIDFGIAVVKASRFEQDAQTLVAGTFPYAAPEQLAGHAGASSDAYALAVIVYEMLTGKCPFRKSSPVELFLQQKEGVRQSVRELRSDVPEEADRILMKALSYEPADRCGSVAEFTDRLACALTCGIAPAAAPLPAQTRPPWSRRRALALASAAVLASAAAGLLWWKPWFRGEPAPGAAGRSLRYYVVVQKFASGKPVDQPFRLAGEMLFPEGYRIRLMFTCPEPGYFYLLNEAPAPDAAAPAFNVLFPSPARKDGSALLSAGEDIPIPSAESYFVFDDQRGEEKLWMVWSRRPLPELEAVKQWVNPRDRGRVGDAAAARTLAAFFERNAASRARKEIDPASRTTVLRGAGDLMIHLLKLEHY